MVSKGFRRLPIVLEDMTLRGIVTATDIICYAHSKGKALKESLSAPIADVYVREVVYVDKGASIADAMTLMSERNIGGLPVVNEEKKVWAIVTERDILFSQLHRLPSETVGAIMTKEVVVARESDSLGDGCSTICFKGFRRLPVLSDRELFGIVTTMDILRFLVDAYDGGIEELFSTPLSHVCVRNVYTVRPTASIKEAASVMKARNIGALPVVEGSKLVGIITERDLFNLLV